MLLGALSEAGATVEGDTLVIGVAQAQIEFLESERNTLAESAQRAFGCKLRIVLKPGGQDEIDASSPERPRTARPAPVEPKPAPAVAASAKAPNKSALKSRALADPVVGQTMDMFGGTLLDVRPLASAPESTDEGSNE
jgi:hypothetical protein